MKVEKSMAPSAAITGAPTSGGAVPPTGPPPHKPSVKGWPTASGWPTGSGWRLGTAVALGGLLSLAAAPSGCGDDDDAATGGPGADTTSTSSPSTGDGGDGANGPGAGGAGGSPPVDCSDDPSICSGGAPVCDPSDNTCVPCTADEIGACAGTTPVCEEESRTCRGCRYHADCPDSACNPLTGACLAGPQVRVGTASGDLDDAIKDAATETTLVVEPRSGNYELEDVTLEGGAVLAILAAPDAAAPPRVQGTNDGPTFLVRGGATLLLAGLNVTLNATTDSPALVVGQAGPTPPMSAGSLVLDRVEVRRNDGGGISAVGMDTEVWVRSSIVAANGNDTLALELGADANLTLLYSSIGASGFTTSAAISCAAGIGSLTGRNSILFNRNALPAATTLVNCDTASFSYSAADEALPGAGPGNVTFADPAPNPPLFSNVDNGDLRLTDGTDGGVSVFEDVAQWQAGDPPTDIDGAPRPTEPSTADIAGAHLGP